MPEYLGYQPQQGAGIVEWSKLTGQLNEKIDAAVGVRQGERDAFADIRKTNEEKINEYESGQNQTMNTLVLDGANNIRSMMYEWNKMADNGEMTRADFKSRMNNVQSYWGMLATSAKSFDTRTMEVLKRQQPDPKTGLPPGSGFESWTNKKHSEIADLKNKQIYTNPESGKVYLTTMGENGEVSEQLDVRQMNNPGNMIDNRIALGAAVTEGTKGWKDWSLFKEGLGGRTLTTTDIRKNPQYVNAKNALVRSIMPNDRAAASILVDNGAGNYAFYSSDEEKMAIIKQDLANAQEIADETGMEFDATEFSREQEKQLILVEKDGTGTWQPSLTETQRKAAKTRIESEVEVNMGMEEKGSGPWRPDKGTTININNAPPEHKDYANYATIKTAWETGDFSGLQVAAPNYKFTPVNEKGKPYKVIVQKMRWDDDLAQNIPSSTVEVKNARDLAPFIFGEGMAGKGVPAYQEYDSQKQRYNVGRGNDTPKYTEADIKATMAANPGVTREDVIKAFDNE